MGKLKQIFLSTIAVVLFFGLLFEICEADEQKSGSLKINNHVIYENSDKKINVDTNFEIPDLFLPAKEHTEEELKKQREMIVNTVKNNVFKMDDRTNELSISQKIVPNLFKQIEFSSIEENSVSNKKSLKISDKILIFSGIILTGSILLIIGILLGNRFSYHRKIKERIIK